LREEVTMTDSASLAPAIRRLQELLESGGMPRAVEVPTELLLEAAAHVDALGDVARELGDVEPGAAQELSDGCDELVSAVTGLLWEPPDGDVEWASHPLQVTFHSRSSELAGVFYAAAGERRLRADRITHSLWIRASGTVDPRYAAADVEEGL
jgi:hypothetical protein